MNKEKTNIKLINRKDVKEIKKMISDQFGFDDGLDYSFFQNDKGRVFIVTKDISNIDFERLKINNIGLYFAQIKNGRIRLSIDGSQLIGGLCSKNVLEVDDKKSEEWMRGEEITTEIQLKDNEFYIIKNKNDFIGSGKASGNRILNFIGKPRRLMRKAPS